MKLFFWILGFLTVDFLLACLLGKFIKFGNPSSDVEIPIETSHSEIEEERCVSST